MKSSDVWKVVKEHCGVAVQYGNTNIYEIILQGDSRNKCCIVVSDTADVNEQDKKIAKSINEKCFICKSEEMLKRILNKIK